MEVTFCTFWKGKTIQPRYRLLGMTFKTLKGKHSRYNVDGGSKKVQKENDRCPQMLERPQSKQPDQKAEPSRGVKNERAAFTYQQRDRCQMGCRFWGGWCSREVNLPTRK